MPSTAVSTPVYDSASHVAKAAWLKPRLWMGRPYGLVGHGPAYPALQRWAKFATPIPGSCGGRRRSGPRVNPGLFFRIPTTKTRAPHATWTENFSGIEEVPGSAGSFDCVRLAPHFALYVWARLREQDLIVLQRCGTRPQRGRDSLATAGRMPALQIGVAGAPLRLDNRERELSDPGPCYSVTL